MTTAEMERAIRDVRTKLIALSDRSTDPELKQMAQDGYYALTDVLGSWHVPADRHRPDAP